MRKNIARDMQMARDVIVDEKKVIAVAKENNISPAAVYQAIYWFVRENKFVSDKHLEELKTNENGRFNDINFYRKHKLDIFGAV